jgi:predicted transcriptional regulator
METQISDNLVKVISEYGLIGALLLGAGYFAYTYWKKDQEKIKDLEKKLEEANAKILELIENKE